MITKLINPKSRIIIALDCDDRFSSFKTMDSIADYVDAIKINYPLVLKEGISIISDLKQRFNKPIIADFKIADAPVTNNRIATIAYENGADFLMVHAIIGSDAIYELKKISENKCGIFIVTELTHPGGIEFTRQYSKQAAEIALKMDCVGIQAPGTRPDQIRELRKVVGIAKIIIACGIGHQGGEFKKAIQNGADYAIIGRSIYQNENPREAIIRILSE